MVSIIPSERTGLDVVSKAIGSQLSQNLPGAVQQGHQRQQGFNALEQAKAELAQAGNDPVKIGMILARSAVASPEAGKALAQLYPQILTQAQRKTGVGDFPAGQTKGGIPLKEGQEVPVSVTDLVPARESFIQDPQGVSQYQLPYGPEEISNIRQMARQKGYTPEMEERFVNDAKEYNQIAQNRREIELQNYQQAQKQREDTLVNQKLFEEYMTSHDPEFAKNPDELELALKSSEKYQNEPSFAARNAKVKEELRPYQSAKKALDIGLQRGLFGQSKERRDALRPRAKFMVENGQKPQLQLMIAKNGLGEIEEADLLNPLPEQIESTLQKGFPKFINPIDEIKNIEPGSKKYEEEFQYGLRKREAQNKRMIEYLSEKIEPGTYKEPGTNLLLVRKNLMDKNLSWSDAGKLIDESIKSGEIKLDPQQKIDYQKLAYPPLTGETYSDTILNNLLFPITRKE